MKKKKIIPLARKHDLKRGVDYIGVNVVFYCHDGKGNILLHKRSQQCRDELGRWDSGAGSMEFGESFADAVTREVFEEYGVKPKKIEYVMTKEGPEPVQKIEHKVDYQHYIEKQIKPIADSVLVFFNKNFEDIIKGNKQTDLSSF